MTNTTDDTTFQLAGAESVSRHFFENDSAFKGVNVHPFLLAYEKAARRASSSAKRAIESNSLESIRIAQWDSAVVQTLERALTCFEHTLDSDEFTSNKELMLPEPPNFRA